MFFKNVADKLGYPSFFFRKGATRNLQCTSLNSKDFAQLPMLEVPRTTVGLWHVFLPSIVGQNSAPVGIQQQRLSHTNVLDNVFVGAPSQSWSACWISRVSFRRTRSKYNPIFLVPIFLKALKIPDPTIVEKNTLLWANGVRASAFRESATNSSLAFGAHDATVFRCR